MAYEEYLDLFYNAQKHECPYRAFMFDVVNSKNEKGYYNNRSSYFKLIFSVIKEIKVLEIKENKKILLDDENNIFFTKNKGDQNLSNPMLLGDMVCFFVKENSISTEQMKKIFSRCMEKENINYNFHFATGAYETNIYAEGSTKLFKGYTAQILEKISKNNKILIKSDENIKNTGEKI